MLRAQRLQGKSALEMCLLPSLSSVTVTEPTCSARSSMLSRVSAWDLKTPLHGSLGRQPLKHHHEDRAPKSHEDDLPSNVVLYTIVMDDTHALVPSRSN